jgi:TPR repeat protein
MNLHQLEIKYCLTFKDNLELENEIIKIFNSDELKVEDYDLNNPKILNLIGCYYIKVLSNMNESEKFFKLASNLGYFESIYNLSNHFMLENIDFILEKIEIIQNNSYKQQIYKNIGTYYKINKNYELMKKYYLIAIELGCYISMNNLAYHYQYIEINIELMLKYYNLAIENKFYLSSKNLAIYYYGISNFEEMDKYISILIELNTLQSTFELGVFFQYTEINYELMKKYYLISINLGNYLAMNNLAHYYQYKEINIELMLKYYNLAIEKNYVQSILNLINYYKNISNDEKINELYIKGILLGNIKCFEEFKKYNINNNKIYEILSNIENPNKIILNELKILEDLKKECIVCYENKIHQKFKCNHEICGDCFMIIKKCCFRCL